MLYFKQKFLYFSFRCLIKTLVLFFASLALVACSIAPLYSDQSKPSFNLNFAEPNSRLEQIVYTDLVGYFGRSIAADALMITIRVSSSPINPGLGSIGLVGSINIAKLDRDDLVFSGKRTASATYISSNQRLANQQAANEASERAAHNLAQIIRISILSILSRPTVQ